MKASEPSNSRFSVGFPWLAALTTYTISWGWSLIRPNTLYWDDWAYIFNQPKSYLSEIFTKTGLAPWRALIDQELLGVGYWTIRWLTFIMFFMAGLFLFEILKKIPSISLTQSRSIVLIFLILPLNHARISLTMFGYTTSYFFFFLAWMFIVKRSSWLSFLPACVCFAWSFMTHSFLIFLALPILHFVYLHRKDLSWRKLDHKTVTQFIVLLGIPLLYYILRSLKWPPDVEYLWYHTIYLRAVFVSLIYLLPCILSAIGVVLWVRRGKQLTPQALMLTLGFLAFGIGVFPYISSGNLDSRAIFFFWELDWTSRHQLLMPLGLSMITVAIAGYVSTKYSQTSFVLISAVMISLNIFWGIGSYVDSMKKEDLEKQLSVEIARNKSGSFVFIDETQHFNFRGSEYRRYEYAGILIKAGISSTPVVNDDCGEDLNQTEVIIRSKQSLLQAFLSGDLGLSTEIRPCKSN